MPVLELTQAGTDVTIFIGGIVALVIPIVTGEVRVAIHVV
jgi:hypothetical protein